ncbi:MULTISPECIES: fumarylacetoacetate hydrolase family protein [Protofrankia]|uniref:2-hydroxyhepta-2,4-diene-1,7-dioate isomerase n=1 Tax=Protofrankia coriariae TaxID=1562887 RepID=A0ABR5F861_9ACTN|nr:MULTISPECIES: fumarylacetoacetate hydrolase family protein [Protofrankia]KLL12830.1 2-hydroxyhepta-2,4-diene-1,7-dioate isomerase [Protofrankia coriariae]ONH36323.1 2-hydroxyhepta-2,4-diene-1,7-dioate isomerase [Protofrankia sp. BMG5.30]
MRIARFTDGTEPAFGVVEGSVETGEATVATITPHPFGAFSFTGARHALGDVRLLAPVLPSKVLCVGKNYADHVREMGGDAVPQRPVLFLKPSTSVVGPGDPVALPADSDRVDYEGELAIVVGRLCRDVPAARALDVVLGYTCANDVTARDQQQADGQWTRAKGHDTFCPVGPWIETDLDASDLAIRTTVDGELRQDSRTKLLVHDIPSLIAYMSAAMTLLPGDLLLTGTPAGVGPLNPGQTVAVTVEGIGTLTNPVVAR